MSGRGLGITGGTIDKLESIPGYRTNISIDEFKNNVKEIGISLISQTMNLAPADKKIYALRDAIACTDSTPLIASSIMSKKIAAGANAIVLDVTCGKGAFMSNKDSAKKLAKLMILIGKDAGRETACVLTNMDEPLGKNVGNSLEVIEAIEALNGNMSKDVEEVVLAIASQMMRLSGKYPNINENKKIILDTIKSGKALEKMKELVKRQGGDISYIENLNKFEKAPFVMPVLAKKKGYVEELDAGKIGRIGVELGIGRVNKDDIIDPQVGFVFEKKIGDQVEVDDILAYVHSNSFEKATACIDKVYNAYKIGNKKVLKKNIIEIL